MKSTRQVRHGWLAAQWGVAAVAFAALVAPAGSFAADADYFKGKTFTVSIGSNPGGGTDTTARVVANHWGKHIPGTPEVLVRNKGNQVIAANDLHHRTRPDGLTVAVFAGGGSLGAVARKADSVQYDPTKWGMVGSIEKGSTILMVRKSALSRLTDPKAEPVSAGSVSTDRPQDAMAVFGGEVLGWNLKIVLGYPSSNDIYLAYERGEIDMFGSATNDILNRFVETGGAVLVAADKARPDFPKVKLFDDLLAERKPSPAVMRAYRAWTGASVVDKYFATPPGTPGDVLEILRESFIATTKDPAFIKEANSIFGEGWAVFSGPIVHELVSGALEIPDDVKDYTTKLRQKYGLPQLSSAN